MPKRYLFCVPRLPRNKSEANEAAADELAATRHSLLSRFKHWEGQESWRTFFDGSWRLICGFAWRSGLSHEEAQTTAPISISSARARMAG